MAEHGYPHDFWSADKLDPDYRDIAAVQLYIDAGGGKLVGALRTLHQSLVSQSAKLEEYYNTPYTEDHARVIRVTVEAIERVELQIERWHHLLYPNQKPKNNA